MLFTFNKFWKSFLFLIGSWFTYSFLGYEFAVVTLLSLICCTNFKDSQTHI